MAAASLALPVGSAQAVSLARAGAAPITSSAPPHSCRTTYGSGDFQGLGQQVSVAHRSMAAPSPHGKSGSFKHSGQRSSMVHHSVTAPSPCDRFSCTRVLGGDRMGGKVEDKEI
jgi:hypothetical protein